MTQEEKQQAQWILAKRLDESEEQVKAIEPRLYEYIYDLATESENHNGYEILCAVKFLRLLRTYEFNHKKVRQVVWLREGDWHQEASGRWVHDSDGLKCPGTDTAHVYRWQPFQIFVLASVFGFQSWVDTQVRAIDKAEILPTERVREDGIVEDLRRLCNYFVCYMPRKTDKTGLSAYIQLIFFLMEDYNSEAYCCAMSEQQSKILFNRVKFMLSQLNEDQQWRMTEKIVDWKPLYRGVRNSSITPLTAGGKAKDGAFAQLVNWDEFGSSPYTNGKSDMQALVNVMRSSMGPRREPLTFGTTTAGTIQLGPFIDMLEGLHQQLLRELKYETGEDTPTLSGDRSLCLLLEPDDWEKADEEYLLTSKTLRRKINPMLGITCQHQFYEDSIEEMHSGKMTKQELIAKLFNVYQTATVTEWIKPEKIRTLQIDRRIDDCLAKDGWVVFVGMDFSQGDDLHTAGYLAARSNGKGGVDFFADFDAWVKEDVYNRSSIHTLYESWVSKGFLHISPGEVFQPTLFVDRLEELLKKGVQFLYFGFDAYRSGDPINTLKQFLIEKMGVKEPEKQVVPVRQTNAAYAPQVDKLTLLMNNDVPLIHYSCNSMWPWLFGNCVLDEDKYENKAPRKRSPGSDSCKVDPIQTICTALKLFNDYENSIKPR